MAKVKFKNSDIEIDVVVGTKISQCIREAGISIETPCNCVGICGKCKVKVQGELFPPSKEEEKFLSGQSNIRLACFAKIKGDAQVEVLNKKNNLKIINRGYSIDVKVKGEIKQVRLPKIDLQSPTPYADYLNYDISSINIFEKLGNIDKSYNDELYGVVYNNKLMDISTCSEEILGVAVDIGTTGLSAYLIDLKSGDVISKSSALNPQTEFGSDVLSRITYCMNSEEKLKILKTSIIRKINEMIEELVEDNFIRKNVYRVIVAGNTTMLHLFLGINPISIAKAPYRPIFLDKVDIGASEIGIDINKSAVITLLPSASGYIGSDILSGIIATAFNEKKYGSIFIDIGTNGEIVAIYNGRLVATSTAAGPAFEGMNISCGARAEDGAIDTFNIDSDYNITFSTIGEAQPKGICGSGLIDIIACLVEKNIVLSSGRFNSKLNKNIINRLKDKKFYITDNIYISQKDIRQIQLAKGAIAAGISMLLKEIGMPIVNVEEAVIAGAFGYHINSESIKSIGIIPKGFKGKITFVGNSSIEGARLALINEKVLKNMVDLRKNINVLELSVKEEFQEYFIRELTF